MEREYEFWPFVDDADDDSYGPISDETIATIIARSLEEAVEKLPPCSPGCHWGLVAIV
jgi:hypothetical protein